MPDLVLEVAVKGMMNLMDAGIKYKTSEIFYASSSEVYNEPKKFPTDENAAFLIPDPKNPRFSYSGGKIISELIALNYGKKYFKRTVIFRPHNVYGPDMGNEHVIPQFSKRMNDLKNMKGTKFDFPIQGSGKESRAYIHVEDFISGVELLLNKGKNLEIYNIGVRKETTTSELAEKVAKVLDVEIKIRPGKILEGSASRRVPDISKISKLGFKPKISLDEGLSKTVNWYIDNKN
jgi:nucleoside-diphosphate-sugar epimerase